MNTSQKIQRIIAAALLAASAGLALSSCAGQRQITEPDSDRLSDAQIVEQRAAYLDLAERRAAMSRDGAQARTGLYLDQAERRAGVGGPMAGDTYRDLAERRAGIGGPVVGDAYRDLSERRLQMTGH
ncbi:hypothetical protein [Agromyces albus]|uniref:hypothetical protein n=1 Tax=Agromyces albus TaxID=205332 RepID=UPI0027876D2E|nr:hypothetical protein [Agromyces albus]MDQ0575800.1 23S rRNA G2069 N7-methylase RlmK/C1962 C5-methylase RlmI [Agromyces albus]